MKTGFFEYVDSNGAIIRGFTDCNTEEEAEQRAYEFGMYLAELEEQNRLLNIEANRTDNWNPERRFVNKIRPESPLVVNIGLRINRLGTRGLKRRLM